MWLTPAARQLRSTRTAGGNLISNGIIFADSNSGLDSPSGLAFDNNGNLYVANFQNNTILEFTNSGGTLSTNATVFANTGLDAPYGLAFDTAGNLYAANYLNGTIEKFAYTAGMLSHSGTTVISSGVQNPTGLAFDRSGNLYVANLVGFGDRTIEQFTNSGGILSTNGTTFADSLDSPFSLVFDVRGNLYYTDIYGCAIGIFTNTDGILNGTWAAFANLGQNNPTGLAISEAGTLYVAYTGVSMVFSTNAIIEKFSSTGADLGQFAVTGNRPFSMAFQPSIRVPLSIKWSGTNVVLMWTDPSFALQATFTINGSFTNIPDATSPYTNFMAGSQQFFRLQKN